MAFFYSCRSIAKLEAAENNIVEFPSKRTVIYGCFRYSIQFYCRPEMCAKTYTRVIINAPLNTNCIGDIKTCRGTVFIIAFYIWVQLNFVYFFIRFAYTYKQYSLYCGCTKLWYSLYCGCTKLVITSWRLQLRHSATTKPGNNCHLIMFNGYYIWKVFFHIYVKLTVFFSSACRSGRTRTVYFGVLAKVDVSYKMKLKIAIEIKITMQITFLLLLFIYNLFENAFQRKLF